jgi:hypothetical protein
MAGITGGQWRDQDAYLPILRGGRSALAWELLRRNPDYGGDVAGKSVVQDRVVPAMPGCAERWGLHFRL